jgi:D-amino-acid oxidase
MVPGVRVTVIGAGISGLCCAIRLAEAGHDVRVVARERPGDTVSALAGAIWFPFRVGPPDRVPDWAGATYAELARLAEVEPAAGVRMVDFLAVGASDPWWAPALPAGAVREVEQGTVARVPIAEPPVHLGWLEDRLRSAGAAIELRSVATLEHEADGADAVVNCTGLGAQALAGDRELGPVQGTVLLVRPRRGAAPRHLVDDRDPDALAYVLPRSDGCVVGGTAVAGERSTTPDPEVVRAILDRARRLEPELEGGEVLRAAAGLRPVRPAVRLEAETLPGGGLVVHDYGHGGGGYTLCWGCADEVRALVDAHAMIRR